MHAWLERSLYVAAAVAVVVFALQALVPAGQAKVAVASFEAPPTIDPGAPLGVLRVPRLGIEAPIHAGADEDVLTKGIGWIPGTAPLGTDSNTGLAAHRDSWFRPLKGVQHGDLLELQTRTGARTYEVIATEVVAPEQVSVLTASDHARLTLVTCHPFNFVGDAPNRFIVHAVLAED